VVNKPMSAETLRRLHLLVPRNQDLVYLSREQNPIFAQAVERLVGRMQNKPRQEANPAEIFALGTRTHLYTDAAIGALRLIEQKGDALEVKLATQHAELALIYAYGMQKRAQDSAQLHKHQAKIMAFTQDSIAVIADHFNSDVQVMDLVALLENVQERNWQTAKAPAVLPIIIGANWCPDTARVVETANLLEQPVVIMFSEYLQPAELKGTRKQGIALLNDHAQAVWEEHDGYGKSQIPVVRFANGTILFEPSVTQFVSGLVANDYL
jgi:hypothetical protein